MRRLHPISESLPLLGIFLIVAGMVFFFGGLIVHDAMRHLPPGTREAIAFFGVAVGVLIELLAGAACITWLYQAWRIVLHEDEDLSPGLVVGLLLVPFFNLYWMFRAIPGLSSMIQRELQLLAPTRVYSTGWVPGLAACILVLIPLWGAPVAICMFMAWMLITNNAIHRLIRFHEQLRGEDSRETISGDG